MKRIVNGKYIYKGYRYLDWEIHSMYYSPEDCVYWEAINVNTGEADYHGFSKEEIKYLIDLDN